MSTPATTPGTAPNPWLVTAVVMLGMIMSIIDSSIVNVAVPHMMGTLGASVSEVSWVVTGYILANVIIIPLSAWLASVVGRARLYGLAVMVFTAASALCGVAPTLVMLIAARAIQGLAAGLMMPLGQAILYESFPPERRGASMAVFGLGIMVGPAVGPTLGGYITDTCGWPWIFYINLPIGILASIVVPLVLSDPDYLRRRANARGDVFYVTPFDGAARTQVVGTAAALTAGGMDASSAPTAALLATWGRVAKAATELAFQDVFRTIALMFVLCLPLLLMLGRRASGASGSGASGSGASGSGASGSGASSSGAVAHAD